jgi:Tfp pilus assembly protein PilP
MAAANAHVAAPKPTTALLLNEVQVTGIFRTPRGWSAMVEATPLTPKLSYVIYPGENFFDGQLVAIEENRLVFRRDVVWADGRREKGVEIKPLRAPSPVETMTSAKTSPAETPAPETAKPGNPEKQ